MAIGKNVKPILTIGVWIDKYLVKIISRVINNAINTIFVVKNCDILESRK